MKILALNYFVEIQLNTQKLEKQLEWYKSFFDNVADAILVVQPQTWCVLDANPHAALLLRMNMDEIIGATLPEFRQIFKILEKSAVPTVLSEMSFSASDETELVLEVSAKLVNNNGQMLIYAVARDVSERSALSDKMVQADKMMLLGQLSAGIAHEIRNPLAAINLNLQFLQRKTAKDSSDFTYISSALSGVERITRIVEATLNFSRAAVPFTKPEQLNAIIVNSVELSSPSLRRKPIAVHLDLSSELPEILVDYGQVQQVFINLLTNAADAIRGKGEISIQTYIEPTAKNDGTMAVAKVQDTGYGISPSDLSQIFTPFYTKKPDGTGLGLPISQRIVHQHGGQIEVESTVNEGTTFYVKFPIPFSTN